MELIVLHTFLNCIFYYEYIFVVIKLNVKKNHQVTPGEQRPSQSPLNFPYPSIKYIQKICSQATVTINSYQKCYLLKKTNKVLGRRVTCTPSKHLKNQKASHTGDSSELFPKCPVILITVSWALETTVKSFELPLN